MPFLTHRTKHIKVCKEVCFIKLLQERPSAGLLRQAAGSQAVFRQRYSDTRYSDKTSIIYASYSDIGLRRPTDELSEAVSTRTIRFRVRVSKGFVGRAGVGIAAVGIAPWNPIIRRAVLNDSPGRTKTMPKLISRISLLADIH